MTNKDVDALFTAINLNTKKNIEIVSTKAMGKHKTSYISFVVREMKTKKEKGNDGKNHMVQYIADQFRCRNYYELMIKLNEIYQQAEKR